MTVNSHATTTPQPRRLRVLLSAYACEPGKGSEPGTGWAWAKSLAPLVDLTVVTRANNRGCIEAEVAADPALAQVRWMFIDGPPALLRLKRGKLGQVWYYTFWQAAVWRHLRKAARAQFDVVHHATYMSMGFSAAPFLRIPSVVGPVGGLQEIPPALRGVAGDRTWESVRRLRNRLRLILPGGSLTLRRASRILVANQASIDLLPATLRSRAHLSQIGVAPPPCIRLDADVLGEYETTTILWGGIHVRWKGLELLLRALADPVLAESPVHLIVSGEGKDSQHFRNLASQLRISVQFVGMLPRTDYLRTLHKADIFAFTSLRETTGLALLEAMIAGKACVAIDHGGPGDLLAETGTLVGVDSPQKVVTQMAIALKGLLDPRLRKELGETTKAATLRDHTWPGVAQRTVDHYRGIISA